MNKEFKHRLKINPDDPIIPDILKQYIKLYTRCKYLFTYNKSDKETDEKTRNRISLINGYICGYTNIDGNKVSNFHLFSTIDDEYPLAILMFISVGRLVSLNLDFTNIEKAKEKYGNLYKIEDNKL